MSSRRSVLKMMGMKVAGLTAAVNTLPATAVAASSEDRAHAIAALTSEGSSRTPWWLLHPLHAGSPVGLGWTVQDLSDIDRGAAVLSLAHRDGRTARVHICAHGGRPKGLAHSALLDLILMDGGQGDRQTAEDLGRALKDLARRIRSNEVSDKANLRPLAHMMTHAERVALYGAETLV